MLKNWAELEQVYLIKVKGMLTLGDLERLGKEIGVRMRTLRQPDATRGRARRGTRLTPPARAGRDGQGQAANYWYEVRMRDTKKDEMRNVLFREQHPLEKMKRIGLGPLTVEGVPPGRYRMLERKEVEELRKVASDEWRVARKTRERQKK